MSAIHPQSHRHPRRAVAAQALLVALATLGIARDAGAVFQSTGFNYGNYGIALQVGSPGGTIDLVRFTVDPDKVGNGTAVTGTNTSTTGSSVQIRVTPVRQLWDLDARTVTLTVDSPANLSCTSGICSGQGIPFSKISWTASDSTTPTSAQWDIQNGSFSATSLQLARFNNVWGFASGSREMISTLTFRYANDAVYAAGTYRGQVRFTAAML